MITTARILADKALQQPCGQACVDWAISMLEQGRDGGYLSMLASMAPPFNHFEVAELRDRSLQELGVAEVSDAEAITRYATETLRLAASGAIELEPALAIVKDLCVATDYSDDLHDFYLLYFAYTDLQESEVQWYWEGATRSNIESIVRERAQAYLAASNDS